MLFYMRHPDSPLRWPVWIGSYGLAATVGVMRVQAGRHFWSDIFVGALMGTAMGTVVTWLHIKEDPKDTLVSVNPWIGSGSGGVSASLVW